jgi:hypothetical protein
VLIAGFLAISSCATPHVESPSAAARVETRELLLNSERIRRRFGSYGIDVIRDNEQLRVSNLYSLEDGRKIMRTLAVVIYPHSISAALMAEHGEIKSGQSIGEVFSRHGWSVKKQNMYLGAIKASPEFAGVYASMGGIAEATLAVHVYQLSVGKNGAWIDYAQIAEVHQPEHLDLAQLGEIYEGVAVESEPARQDVQNTLDLVVNVMQNF